MDIIAKIALALKKKHEDVVFDIYIKDYEHNNYYFALVFSNKIKSFKILFVPLDLIDDIKNVSEYFCYQFIYLNEVEYILSTMNKNIDKIKNMNLNRKTIGFDSYYVELNYYDKSKYTFKFSQYIDKDFLFLFDIIAVFFEYLPNIVSELCMKLLQDFNNNNISYRFNYSMDMDLLNDSLDEYEDNDLSFDNIKYIERIGNKYYVYLFGQIVVIEYVRSKRIVNVCSNFERYSSEMLLVIKAIRDEIEKKYSRLIYDDIVYACYDITDNKFNLLGNDDLKIDFDNIKFRFLDDYLRDKIDIYLSDNYSKKEIKNIYNKIMEE